MFLKPNHKRIVHVVKAAAEDSVEAVAVKVAAADTAAVAVVAVEIAMAGLAAVAADVTKKKHIEKTRL